MSEDDHERDIYNFTRISEGFYTCDICGTQTWVPYDHKCKSVFDSMARENTRLKCLIGTFCEHYRNNEYMHRILLSSSHIKPLFDYWKENA